MPNVLIIDDHPIIAVAIKNIIKSQFGEGGKVTTTTDSKTYLVKLKEEKFDLIMMDLFIPDTDSQDLLHQTLRIQPDAKVLIQSSGNEEIYALHYVKQGAFGFISKAAPTERLEKAIRTVLANEKYLSRHIMDRLIDDLNGKKSNNPFLDLSKREMEVAKLIALGKGVKEIADILKVHSSTIGTQKKRIFKSLNVSNTREFDVVCDLHRFLSH